MGQRNLMTPFTYMFINPLLGLRICLTFCYPSYPKLLIFCRNRVIIFSQFPEASIIYETFYFSSIKKNAITNDIYLSYGYGKSVFSCLTPWSEIIFRQDRQQLFIFREFPGSNHDAETECTEDFLSFRYVFSAQVVIRRPVYAKARFPSKPSPCSICVAESDTLTCLSPGTSVFPFQYHSIGAPYSYFISNENTNLMQHCAGFISAGSLYMFRAQAPIIRSI